MLKDNGNYKPKLKIFCEYCNQKFKIDIEDIYENDGKISSCICPLCNAETTVKHYKKKGLPR